MTRLRKLTPGPPKLAAVGPTQWNLLLRKAIARAQLANDPRVTALQTAMHQGTAEKTLRRMSIICEADVIREFTVSST